MVSKETTNEEIVKNNGFSVLQVKYRFNSNVIRHLFIKQFALSFHKNSNDDKPENRTLFIINVPPFVTEYHMRYLFEKSCGKINKVFLQAKPSMASNASLFNKIQNSSLDMKGNDSNNIEELNGDLTIMSYKVCYVVFNKPQGLTNALNMVDNGTVYPLRPDDNSFNNESFTKDQFYTGINLWKKQYNESLFEPTLIKEKVEKFLDDYKNRPEEEQDLEMADTGPDEDGWITVDRTLRRNRKALVNDQFHDQKVIEKYNDRNMKRKTEEKEFDQKMEPIVEMAAKKKKKKKIEF